MTIQEFARRLDDRPYGEEITREEEKEAKELGFVVVFGASDDLIEFRGAINDEAGCYEGGKIYINKDGILDEDKECDECKYFQEVKKKCKAIKALWCKEEAWAWTYKTDIPHATFEIFEDEEQYCRGIVFDINNLGG